MDTIRRFQWQFARPGREGGRIREDAMANRGRRRRVVLSAAVVALSLLGGGYAGVCLLTAERLTRPTNHPLPFDPRRVSKDAEAWSARTSDGVTLRGWYLPTRERRQLIVLVHGMWSSWIEMAALGRDLHQGGYDILLFDLRGHGQSDPSRLTLGRRERNDIRAVMNWALDAGFTPGSSRLAGLFDGSIHAAS